MMDFNVSPIQYADTKEWCMRKHYAHRMPPITYAFGLYEKNKLIGICTYGHPFSSDLKKCMGDKYKDKLLELNRLCVNDNLPKNTLSWFVGQTFNRQKQTRPACQLCRFRLQPSRLYISSNKLDLYRHIYTFYRLYGERI